MENSLTVQKGADDNLSMQAGASGQLTVADLCRMFEESEESTFENRELCERDRDYVDNKQLTSAEIKTLESRGQQPSIDNRVKTKVDYLVGFEKTQRIMPKAMPRTPQHESDADGATEALRYVADKEDYSAKRSAVWRNMLVEGSGGISVCVKPAKRSKQDLMANTAMTQPQEFEIELSQIAWDRMFADPHSSKPDYSDAGYLGEIVWMDVADAKALYRDNPDADEMLTDTLQSVTYSQTYDDKPKFDLWADKKRKRVRICKIWLKRDDEWYFAEFTKGGILKAGPSPYKTDTGESDGEYFFQSAYVDRDNNRYGLVREMVPLQDEINKRRSKSLHLLNTSQVVYEDGAVDDIEEFRRQAARPDGAMKVAPNALKDKAVQFNTRTDLADGHFKLLQEAKSAIDLKGPNATEMGDNTGGSNSASGKAIIASQQGGVIQLGDLMDNLRHLDKRVFRAIWARVRQYWTAEKWIRVTDDERNVKWVGMNIDPQKADMLRQHPESEQKIAGIVGNVAELDCDIIIDEAPDNTTPQLEQFQTLVELKKYDTDGEIPFSAIVRAAPNLKGKDKILSDMEARAKAKQEDPQTQEAKQLQMRGANAEVAETESRVALNMAKAHEAGMPEHGAQQQQGEYEPPAQLQDAKLVAEIEKLLSDARKNDATTAKTKTEAALAPAQAVHSAHMERENFKLSARKPAA